MDATTLLALTGFVSFYAYAWAMKRKWRRQGRISFD